jgi:hypothetical protein
MRSKYRLQLELIVSKASEGRLIQAARRAYSDRGAAREISGESERRISAEEFIDGVQNALLELVEDNSLLRNTGVEVRAINCSVGEPIQAG